MKYTAQSGKYIFKNFFYIIPFAVLPAFFLCLSTDDAAILCVYETLLTGKPWDMHYEHLFRAISVLNFASLQSILAGIVGIVLTIVCGAMMMALMEKHLRIGKRTYNGLFSKLNDNLISTTGYVFLLLAIYELWTLITSALIFLASKITIAAVAYTFMGLIFLLMHVALISAVGVIYLWLPCMQITGFKALEALHYSYQLMAPVKWSILIGQLLLLFVTEALIAACAIFAPNSIIFIILTTVLYSLLIMIYCVRMQIAYFDRDNIERADIPSYYRH